MKPEQRCLFGVVAGAAIGAATIAAILLAPQPNEMGACLLVMAAVLLLGVLLVRLRASPLNILLVGPQGRPLIRSSFSPRQGPFMATAFGLFGTSLLYGPVLNTSLVIGLGVAGVLVMAYAVVFARGARAVPSNSSESGHP